MKWAYCWACGETVQCYKKTQHEVRMEYFNRRNVVTRRNLREVERKRK